METNIVGFGLGITDRFRDFAQEKADKVALLAERAISLDIKVTRNTTGKGAARGEDRVELTLVGPGPLIRAEALGSDPFVAYDLAMAKLMERLRRHKDRSTGRRGRKRTSLRDASNENFASIAVQPADAQLLDAVATGSIPLPHDAEEEDEADYSPVVIREKLFPAETMTQEEAVDRMELVGHDFFLFIDARSDRPSVVYRRTGWAYGVIGLDDDEQVAS